MRRSFECTNAQLNLLWRGLFMAASVAGRPSPQTGKAERDESYIKKEGATKKEIRGQVEVAGLDQQTGLEAVSWPNGDDRGTLTLQGANFKHLEACMKVGEVFSSKHGEAVAECYELLDHADKLDDQAKPVE